MPDMNDIPHSTMRTFGWLAEKPRDFQDEVFARSDHLHLEKGTSVYEAFDDTGGLIGVVDGFVALHLPERGSANTFSHIGGTGYWTGDISALLGRERRISIIAKTDCSILRLSRAEMQRFGSQNPDAWRLFSEVAARNLVVAIDVIEALKHVDPTTRVAMTLLNLQRDVPPEHPVIPLSQSDIAAAADLSRSSVNIAMKTLNDLGLIESTYGGVTIVDFENLTDFASQV